MELKFRIVGGPQLQAALERVANNAHDASPAMRAISMVLLRESERIFAKEGRGVGLDQPWAPLSETTKKRRAAKSGAGRMKILQDTGKLVSSLTPTSTSNSASLTTNRVYAATMFFGAKQGEFGRDRRNHPLPWGNIHSRVFLPLRDIHSGSAKLTEPAENSMFEVLKRHFGA